MKIQNMRLADDQDLEDWQEYCYVDILKYVTVTLVAKLSGFFFSFHRRRLGRELQMAIMVVCSLISLPSYSIKLCF